MIYLLYLTEELYEKEIMFCFIGIGGAGVRGSSTCKRFG